jgi:hypothetical protein
MHSLEDTFMEFNKGRIYVYMALGYFVLLPILIMILCYNILNKLDIPIPLILFIIFLISSIPFFIFYLHYRDKKESRKKMELREMEDKIFLKNLRK